MFPEDGVDADRLLSEADRRMYIAKQKEKLSVVGRAADSNLSPRAPGRRRMLVRLCACATRGESC